MARRSAHSLSGLFAVLLVLLLATPALAAWNQAYCSKQNTADTDVYTQKFMSNGNCTDHCRDEGTFAFAVIKYQDCYCSNYIPRDQEDVSKCGKVCPGFGDENCGSIDDGLFIYIQNGSPSGTAPAPGPAKPTQEPPTSKAPSQASSQASSQPAPTSQPPESNPTTVRTVTISGVVVTVTPSAKPSPSSTSAPARTDNEDKGPNVGAIAGGVAGGIIGLLAIIGGLIFVLWRRRKQRDAQDGDNGGSSGGITRNTSTMSKAGLLGGTREVEQPYRPARVNTNLSTMNSRYGADHESVSPGSNRRNSQPLVIDSRMNPSAVMTFAAGNLSRESVASLDDSRDYGRQLNVRNPDPS
ncbi:hypothetical protein HBI17_219820 [Parastagonospora nodorum]|nr:hypothetical protein HBH51_230360 [Parastagonospora nodorum]KAH4954697.1 hypothetical protein HBI78_220260 [Parastagonospora nodorum]KAH5730864.1 hypothetical protein HBI17_219820 [Parastagonospora nodorum]KAH6045265.1 hypothetical protein HBI67_241390 [Parastagonospora nodorum]KAH6051349.1 hypothetical protein HBI66_240090 [Parastagonospora nodorum]